MMSLSTIRELSRQAASTAAKQHKVPYVVEREDIEDFKLNGRISFRIPNLGDYIPRGWKRTEREPLFVDSSGFGAPGEPALTQEQFINALKPGYGYAVIQAGQFQVYVGEFEKMQSAKKAA